MLDHLDDIHSFVDDCASGFLGSYDGAAVFGKSRERVVETLSTSVQLLAEAAAELLAIAPPAPDQARVENRARIRVEGRLKKKLQYWKWTQFQKSAWVENSILRSDSEKTIQ